MANPAPALAKNHRLEPRLLVEWQPWWPVFFNNLLDAILRRAEPAWQATSAPGVFWPDVFVHRPLPWTRIGQSALSHLIVITFLLTAFNLSWRVPHVQVMTPLESTEISYYKVSEYLPPVKSAAPQATARRAMKADPVPAAQEIISVPPTPDNSTQTIVDPAHPQIIVQHTPLPNMVIQTPVMHAPPVEALRSRITLPDMRLDPVAPAPDLSQLKQQVKLEAPKLDIVQPAPSEDSLRSEMTITKLQTPFLAPKLAVPEQHIARPAEGVETAQESVPPPPSTQRPNAQLASGALMALSVHPTLPSEKIMVPEGSRSGIFAASPTGRPGAPGIPEVKAAADSPPAGGGGTNSAGAGKDAAGAGVTISGGTLRAGSSAVVAALPMPPVAQPSAVKPNAREVLMAAMRPADVSRKLPPPTGTASERKVEDRIFSGKRFYSMRLNMPNLNSASGSWIIRFAELKEGESAGELSSPVAMSKVDPAFPADLVRERVEGNVLLYAVIHADGSVGEVRVLEGFHEKLDENARVALSKWKFRPATKNGVAVDLEAVVQIPFRVQRVVY